MKVLVCGSRDWTDAATLTRILDKLVGVLDVTALIEGEARGADSMARDWAKSRSIPVDPYKAEWETRGLTAGTERNQRMLDKAKPDLVIAFPLTQSAVTWHMVRIARAAGVTTWVMPADEAIIDALGEGVFA